MAFAIRNDGLGWRAVDSAADCLAGESFSETQPELIELPLGESTKMTSLEFLEKFTQAEQLAVVQATMNNAEIKLWYDKLIAATYVDLTDPRAEAGLDALIAAELIEPSRKGEILTSNLL